MSASIPSKRLETWIHEHHAAVYRAARRVTGADADAEDVTQQVFFQAFEGRLGRGEAEGESFEARLRWLAVKTSLAHLRSSRRRRTREEAFAMKRTESRDEASLELSEQTRVVGRMVDELPEELRLPLVLRFEQEFTFRRIGELCGIAEPTAHERVKRGLERLKAELGRLGLAGLAPTLPGMLPQLGSALTIPAGLEGRLLDGVVAAASASTVGAVSSTATTLAEGAAKSGGAAWGGWSSAAIVCGALALVAGTGVALGWFDDAPAEIDGGGVHALDDGERQDEVRRRVVRRVASGEGAAEAVLAGDEADELMAAGAQTEAELPTGIVRGRLVDAKGAPRAGVDLAFVSEEYMGKRSRFSEETQTDVAGSFEVALPVRRDPSQHYSWVIRSDNLEPRRGVESIAVQAGETHELEAITLRPMAGFGEGSFALDVRVVDAGGTGLAGAKVELFRPDPDPANTWRRDGLITGTADAIGVLHLEGEGLGCWHLRARSETGDHAPREVAVDTRTGQQAEIVVALPIGKCLEGVLIPPDGMQLGSSTWLHLHRGSLWNGYGVNADAEGRFRFRGLDDGTYSVSFSNSYRWSAFRVDGVRAGDGFLRLELKAQEDTRDRGLHLAELHGTVVDAKSGDAVGVDPWDLELKAVGAGSRDQVIARDGIRILTPFFGQTAQGLELPPDRGGRFAIGGQDPGRYMLIVRLRGYAPHLFGPFDLGAGEIRTEVRVELTRGVALGGVVHDLEGEAIHGAVLFVAPAGPEARAIVAGRDKVVQESGGQGFLGFGPTTRSAKDGSFRLQYQVREMSAALHVLHADYQPVAYPLERLKEGQEVGDLEIRLTRPR